MIKSSSGTFDVRLNGELLFSKKAVGRFPAPGEVVERLAGRLPAADA